jgi:hypothetical protein
MYGVEFLSAIKDGVIEVPPEYRKRFKKSVRVILFSDEASTADSLRPFGLASAEFRVPDDFDAPLPECVVHEFEGL